MGQGFLSNTELYYTPPEKVKGDYLIIDGDEVKHIASVMRHNQGDRINVTDGSGHLFEIEIDELDKKTLSGKILQKTVFDRKLGNIVFCLPRLKSSDRFEFALEKCIELGIVNFIVFEAEKSVAKGDKTERWNKVALSAMKQCLRCYKPEVGYVKDLSRLSSEKNVLIFDQNFETTLPEYINRNINEFTDSDKKYFFVFGPEGGLSENEINIFSKHTTVKLTDNRLRAETAVIASAAVIAMLTR